MNKKYYEDEINRLRGVVDELQEKIKLQAIDNSKDKKEMKDLKAKVSARNINIKRAREKLLLMKRLNDFSGINEVLAMFHGGDVDE